MKKQSISTRMTRRDYLKTTALGAAGMVVAPTIVPASVLGKNAPSNKIQIGQIGCGRIARSHDLAETFKYDIARVTAVCDVDRKRMRECKELVEKWYKDNKGKDPYIDVKMYENYQEMLADPGIDAVIISTPDHWHAQIAIEAALAGKHIYMQKPASLTIEEGRIMSDIVHRTGVVFQIGSQQRSVDPWPQFKIACELVRNGRIGEIKAIQVGLPGDPPGGSTKKMPMPEQLNYDAWLGSTPDVYYTLDRVHPLEGYDRPGWLRCEQFGAGMITGWGAHHIDTAHWGMGTEFTGPVEVIAEAEFPTPESGLWDVHGDFKVEAKYENGATMYISGSYPNGVRFEGSEGWIFVTRGNVGVTASDPATRTASKALDASDPKILQSVIGEDEIHLYTSPEQHGNWLDCIKSGQMTVAPVEVAHRSCSACLVSHIAMKVGRKLYWDPVRERFRNDDEANSMLSRPQRFPYGYDFIDALKK